MRNATYEGLFKGLAQRHQLIRHLDEQPRFARVVVSVDPMQKQVDLYEMQTTLLGNYLKADAGEQVLVLESLQTAYQDNTGDNYQHRRRGAFFILEQVREKGREWEALERTELTGEQIMGAVLAQYRDQPKVLRLDVGSIQSDAVGPVGPDLSWYGTRFDFEFFTPATSALTYQPGAFLS